MKATITRILAELAPAGDARSAQLPLWSDLYPAQSITEAAAALGVVCEVRRSESGPEQSTLTIAAGGAVNAALIGELLNVALIQTVRRLGAPSRE